MSSGSKPGATPARPLVRDSPTCRRQRARHNVFGVLMDVVKHCSLGQISAALYEVGGEYRRNR